jgi:diguanylate cyclase (GGDEF)-like protein
MLLNPHTTQLKFVAAKGYDLEILKQTYLNLDQTYLYRESNGKIDHTVFIDNPFDYDRQNLKSDNIENILSAGSDSIFSSLSTPVILGDTLYGMINIDSKFRNAYTKDDHHIIELFALEVINVIKLYQSLEKVNYFMHNDVLTNTYNRYFFNDFLEKKLKKHRNEATSFSLISMDLNHLKKANDTYGHECGDKLLSEFSYGIKKNISSNDCFARYGGDEFQLLLSHKDVMEAHNLMNEINLYFTNHPIIYKGHTIPISFCYGMSCCPDDSDNFEELISLADERMYIQKKQYHELHQT